MKVVTAVISINLNIVEYKDVCSLYFPFISLSINLNIVEYKDSKYGYQDEKNCRVKY